MFYRAEPTPKYTFSPEYYAETEQYVLWREKVFAARRIRDDIESKTDDEQDTEDLDKAQNVLDRLYRESRNNYVRELPSLTERMDTLQNNSRRIERAQRKEKYNKVTLDIYTRDLETRDWANVYHPVIVMLRDAMQVPPRVIIVPLDHGIQDAINVKGALFQVAGVSYLIINGNARYVYLFNDLFEWVVEQKSTMEPTTQLPIRTIERVELQVEPPSLESVRGRQVSRNLATRGLRRMSVGGGL